MGERRIVGGDPRAIGGWLRRQRAGGLHRRLFDERHLVPLHEHAPPRIDLLVDVDLNGADVAAAAIQGRSEGQVAILPRVEGRIYDEADWAGISGPVAQAAAAAVDRAGVHAGAAADAFQRRPELLHAQSLGPAVVHQHHVHLAARPRAAEVRGVLGYWRAEGAA